MTIYSAVQSNKTTVLLKTDKGSKYVVGILVSYTDKTVTVKGTENARSGRICDENDHTIRYIQL